MKKVIFLLAVMVMVLGVDFHPELQPVDILSATVYSVDEGDTLWDIAQKYTDNEHDVRKTVWQIGYDNNLTNADLKTGQQLIIRKF